MRPLRRLYINHLAVLLARSDRGHLYQWAPRRIRRILHRRFARRYLRHREEILAARARRAGATVRRPDTAVTYKLKIEHHADAERRAA